MRCKNSLPLLLLAGSFAVPCTSEATQFVRWENRRETSKTFRLIPELQLLSTSANYDHTGTSAEVPGLSYSRRHLDLSLVYGLNLRASAFARLSLSGVSYQTSSLNGSGLGFGDQAVGFNYRVYESDGDLTVRRTTIDAQLQFDIPFYDKAGARRKTPKNPLLGEGTFDVTAGAFMTVPLNQGTGLRHFLVGGAGFRNRGGAFSEAIPYQAYWSAVPEKSGLMGRIGLAGLQSLSTDNGSVALDNGAIVQDAGGSLIVNALNPSYFSLKSLVGYQINPANQVYVGAEQTLFGTSTANLFALYVGAQFRFGNPAARERSDEGGSTSLRHDLDASVTQTNDRLNLIKLNRGESDGVVKGQQFDIFSTTESGLPHEHIARGVVTDVRSGEAVIEIRQYIKQVVIQPGFPAKRLVR